jgi:hypothetical protein
MDLQHSGRGAVFAYSDNFLSWLVECHQRCQADKVRHFLNDFARYVRSNLGGVSAGEEQTMVRNADQDAILRFVFSREANAELALGVLAARQAIQEKIIKDFLPGLERTLVQKAKELGKAWTVVNELSTNPCKQYAQIYLTKTNWNNLYRIALDAQTPEARDFILGVHNDWDTLKRRLDGGKISQALQGHVRSGITTDWWPFYMWAAPYRHWDDARTLACFLGEKGVQAVSFLAGAMFTIAQATESVIDTVVQEWHDRQSALSSC